MEDINTQMEGISIPVSSHSMQVKLENLISDQFSNVSVDAAVSVPMSTPETSQNELPSALSGTDHSFEFKTPSPVRPPRSMSSAKSSPSRGSQTISLKSIRDESLTDCQKSSKKKTAVKIASFARASAVDRLAPSAATHLNTRISRDNLDSNSTSITSHFPSQNNAGGSKQLTTQTMLPTPALNAALRSYFNYSSKAEDSPSTDASQSDEDEDVEEEEILVYMQFDSKLDSDLLQPHTPFKIIGVDSEKPVLQLGNQVFEGNWNDTVGTAVFFEENPSASPGDPVFMKNPPSTLTYHSKTQKALTMSRIFVRPKEDEDAGGSGSAAGPMVPMAIVEVAP